MRIHFYKYQGTGNDFILIDDREDRSSGSLHSDQIAYLCDRKFGIGADGLMLLQTSGTTDFKMVYFNADGRESSMCGNGGRCIVAFAHLLGLVDDCCHFEATDGIHWAAIKQDQVKLKMTKPYGYKKMSDHSWIHTGSPHDVRFLNESLEHLDVFEEGKAIRYHTRYQADGGTNANFVYVQAPYKLEVRTYERGVEDETLSCGTGVTACAYIYLLEHLNKKSAEIQILTLGGKLRVVIQDLGKEQEEVYLIGPATYVFEGDVEL